MQKKALSGGEAVSLSTRMDRGICKTHTHLLRLQRSRQQQTLPSHPLAILSLLLLVFLCQAPTLCQAQCSDSVGCFPSLGNLARGRTVETDSQCSDGDFFCLQGTTDCSNSCRSSSHSSSSINDGNNGTAWISSIGSASSSNATLQLDFQEPVLFEEMTLLWKSSRPRSMVLERSRDRGLTWEVYRYYSTSCATDFGLEPMNMVPQDITSTDAICTASQSTLFPNTNAEVTFATSEHLQADTSPSDSTKYREITNLRVRLLGQFDLGSDEGYQYYSVGEWLVWGTCMCNGHASTCAPAPGEPLASDKVYSGCMCKHNTEGTHCDGCETWFNAAQWSPGTDSDANSCQRCECNGHAEDCSSENPEEGVQCIDCAHNTEGNLCQMCQIGFYENSSLLFTDPNICIACGCDSAGIADSGACSESGQCNCKERVTGLQCSQCMDGYWNFTASNNLGCQECDCDPRGTVQVPGDPGLPMCDKLTGVCECLPNVGGHSCNICDDGFYSLEDGCLPCGCNVAASAGPVCDKDSPDGQCPCLPNIDTPTCTTPLPGFYFRHLDHLLFEAEEAELSQGVTRVFPRPGSATGYSGRGLVVFPATGTATFSVEVPRDYSYEIILRLQPPSEVEGLNLVIESQSPVRRDLHCSTIEPPAAISIFLTPLSTTPTDHLVVDTVCLEAGATYTVRVQHLHLQTSPWMLDSLLLLPDFSSESAYYAEMEEDSGDTSLLEDCLPRSMALSGVREECRDIAFALSVEFHGQVFECNCSGSLGADADMACDRYGGQCSCREGVIGLQCDICRNGWFNLTSTGCELCGCDAEGSSSSVCDLQTGQCDCQPNVQGPHCDSCAPGHYSLTSAGCSDCNCSRFSTSVQCSDLGQCPCPPGVGGATCHQCLPGYYGISASGCTTCNCSSVGVRSSSDECDIITGQCPCIGNTVARDCSQCPEGFYETSTPDTDACLECVCSNRSNVCTDDSAGYLAAAWLSDFQQLCRENPVTCNDGWQLLTAVGQSAGPFGPSDASGLGYILLVNNNPMLYAPGKFLGDQQSSYGLEFTLSVSLRTIAGLKDTTSVVLESSEEDPPRLVGVFPPPTMQQEPSSLNTILTYSIPLVEDYWRVGSSTGPPATFFLLYSILSNITQLSFSAEFREDFIEFVYVQRVQLPTRVPQGTLPSADLVLLNTSFPAEQCSCPAEYTGSSCQLCARGHARPSGDMADPCVECGCNNLSPDCDVDTAICTNCSGNSEGEHCERCRPGYYGDPTRGIPCLLCQCPSSERSYSPTCFLDSDLGPTCDNCSLGYSGRSCEVCADGYFGNPLVGQCITCECNGNVDPALGPVCDTDNGRCLNCLNNTHGFECQFCQSGYYGDPPSGLPCTPCQCHPNGTVGDCSSLFGTCSCASENVLGEFCDECRDGYWGLSQGLPCAPCDCCSNGSSSHICDKDTGRCDCHENIGSEVDDKCCSCTPGYFDFSPDGCQECGCSALSVSEECDTVSGQCQCQEGAIGLKCDDCAFGFTGTVPNCTECHPCFLQWYQRIQELSEMVAVLQRRASFLVDEYYNGYTVESIEADVQALLDELTSTNSSLQAITLHPSSVQGLQNTLQEINEALAEMDELTRDTEQQLVMAGQMLDTAAAFDGTVNGTTVDELVQEIVHYNSSIAALVTNARNLLRQLQEDHAEANTIWTNISALHTQIQELLGDSNFSRSNLGAVELLLDQLDQQREDLRQNLTRLSEAGMDLTRELVRVNSSVANVSRESSEASIRAEELSSQLADLRSHADLVLNLTRQLNAFIETTRQSSQNLVESTITTLNLLNATQRAAQAVSDEAKSGLLEVEELITQLEVTKMATGKIFDAVLPSLSYVQELVRDLSASILPEDQVAGIATNATASHQIAQQALELARNASEMVRVAQSLISQLNSDLNSTEVTQARVQEALSLLRDTIDNFRYQLQHVREEAAEVNTTSSLVQEVVEETGRAVDSASQLALQLQNRSSDQMHQAVTNDQRSSVNEEVADQLASEAAELQAEAQTQHNDSLQILQNATTALSTAQQLSSSVSQVTLQQLQELLSEYASERETIGDLRERVGTLRAELQTLTSTFTQAAQTLSECYKTP